MAKDVLPMADENKPESIGQATTTTMTGAAGTTQGFISSKQHPNIQQQKQQQLPADCLPCKIVGCAGFGGLGLYSFYQAQQLPKTLVARRLGLGLMGTAFIGAAVYRLTMPINQETTSSSSSVE